MKKLLILSITLIVMLTLAGCSSGNNNGNGNESDVNTTADDEFWTPHSNLTWIVEPAFTYDIVFYCDEHGYTANTYNWESFALSAQSGQIISDHYGHEGPEFREWLFDTERNLFGKYTFGWGQDVALYPTDQFATHFPDHTDSLNYVRQVDSTEISGEDDPSYGMQYSLGEKYANSKYAVAYGNTLLTDFIFDVASNITEDPRSTDFFNNIYYMSNNMCDAQIYKNTIAVHQNGKWGFVDTNGGIAVPFIFDHVASTDGDTAFVKLNGLYGILDVKASSAAMQ